jgi:hypothetical protein
MAPKESDVDGLPEHKRSQNVQTQDFAASLQLLVSQQLESNATDTAQSTSRVMKSLLDAIHVLQDQVDALGKSLKEDESLPSSGPQTRQQPPFVTLHRVFCDKADHCHNKVVYEDQPAYDDDCGWGFDEILKGTIPIFNVGTYLSQRPSIHFVIFKEYACAVGHFDPKPDEHQATRDVGSISEKAERMWIVSRLLRDAIRKVAKFEPYSEFPLLANVKEMDAPYDFFFHHYQRLVELAETDQTYEQALAALLSFLKQNYGAEYAGAKNMFNKGCVSAIHLSKLFQPGGIVVGCYPRTGGMKAGILSDCIPTKVGGVRLRGWRWGYDGTRLFRIVWGATIDAFVLPVEESPITDLAIYPLEFTPDWVIKHIEARGRKFWYMRIQRYASYSGRDSRGKHHAVSLDPYLAPY